MDTTTWSAGRRWTARITSVGPLPAIVLLGWIGPDTETARAAVDALSWVSIVGIATYIAGASGEQILARRP